MSEREELLGCPFCGSPAELEHGSDHHGEWFNLGCSRHWGKNPDNVCPGARIWYTEIPEKEADAIKKWNTRLTLPTDAVERLARKLHEIYKRYIPGSGQTWESLEENEIASYLDEAKQVLQAAGVSGVPEGWKLVPVEPTLEMISAGAKQIPLDPEYGTDLGQREAAKDVYEDMLAAAPER